MTLSEIVNGNEIIAKFEGWEFINDASDDYPKGYWMYENDEVKHGPYRIIDMLYHEDWNWLMEVIRKIGNIEYSTVPGMENYMRHNWEDAVNIYTPIEEMWYIVVKFIKWYNDNK